MYSNEYNLMMDIMRVDDNTSINKKGMLYNAYRIKENKTYKKMQQWAIENNITLTGDILVNIVTDLPTDEYNSCAVEKDISNSEIAYRTCLKGKANIEFFRKAFDYIKKTNSCYILVSDLSNFFDKIDHKKLKNNLSIVLNQNPLTDDYYKIYKSMTKYSYIEKADIIAYLLDNNIESETSLKKCNSLLDKTEWKIVKKKLKNKIIKNDKNYGIPQGSPLSGIFANIYMIDFDKYIKNYVDNKH